MPLYRQKELVEAVELTWENATAVADLVHGSFHQRMRIENGRTVHTGTLVMDGSTATIGDYVVKVTPTLFIPVDAATFLKHNELVEPELAE